jgi:hypothetical protein
MQLVASTNAAFSKVGGHTFSMTYEGGTNGPVHLTGACVECHGDVESFDFKRQDYDGDGIVDGVQTEVKHLLSNLAYLLPPVGTPKQALNITTNWTKPQLKAAYNYQYVLEDGSYGVHNLSWAVGLLKASIGDLTGDSNQDGLSDAWQIQHFGSVSSPDARPWYMLTARTSPTPAAAPMTSPSIPRPKSSSRPKLARATRSRAPLR